jgi:uncharacterized membrane protein YgaE (UPF0421/DUF939 family)
MKKYIFLSLLTIFVGIISCVVFVALILNKNYKRIWCYEFDKNFDSITNDLEQKLEKNLEKNCKG